MNHWAYWIFDPSPPGWARAGTLFWLALVVVFATSCQYNGPPQSSRIRTSIVQSRDGLTHSRAEETNEDHRVIANARISIHHQHQTTRWQIRADYTLNPPPANPVPAEQRDVIAAAIELDDTVPRHIRVAAARMVRNNTPVTHTISQAGVPILAARFLAIAVVFIAPIFGIGRMIVAARCWRMVRRLSNGLCPTCAYELAPGDIPCPECGGDYRDTRQFALNRLDRRRRAHLTNT